MRYLIDTNILCELAKDAPDASVLNWFSVHETDDLLIGSVTIGEIAFGIEKKGNGKEKEKLKEWFDSVLLEWFNESIVNLDTEAMLRWGRLRATGRTLPILDSQIAAAVLGSNAVLVTRDTKDFDGIDSLRLVNPFL